MNIYKLSLVLAFFVSLPASAQIYSPQAPNSTITPSPTPFGGPNNTPYGQTPIPAPTVDHRAYPGQMPKPQQSPFVKQPVLPGQVPSKAQ